MKNKLQYLIIGFLVISNIFFIINSKKKVKSEEFKREMNYLSKRLGFDKKQLQLAIEEYKRYDSLKRKVERKFRKFDLVIMDDITRDINENSLNMSDYYNIAIELNKEKLNHWIKIREIANEDQAEKLDSLWSSMKERVRSNN
ncbi:MAG: hypothetical protein CL870_04850 [Cytophagia bacterium]|jgi:hypothetical protein|nr:hypothetical protein [Cytophagia bacterium]